MSNKQKEEEFYNKLRVQLEESTTWPSAYLYKFIVKTEVDKIKAIEDIFNHSGAVIKTTESKRGTYTSVSVNVVMKDPDEVISKYIEVSRKIEGVISL
ncbi:MAG: DUF493 family protein [Flavobacteriaceae bacterium]|nr:DUF493 family protein [Bacteroidia bacterium]NNF81995.1 DUF493 family protein [Flavobacteriaceae bacterium]NNK69300.1 DUF493 family protein [Flavobacteriaceae bacterium]